MDSESFKVLHCNIAIKEKAKAGIVGQSEGTMWYLVEERDSVLNER